MTIKICATQTGVRELLRALEAVKGGYVYMGMASHQVCFPLKSGGELRIMVTDDMSDGEVEVDLYDGSLPPGITGPAHQTGVAA